MSEAAVLKPRWRGRLHQAAFFVSIPQGLALVAAGAHWMSRVAAMVYALTLSGLYGVSASYHRLRWTPPALLRMRKLDHSMIFLLIAGTYTPFGLLVLDGIWSVLVLGVAWAGAAVGIGTKLIGFEKMRRLGGALYIVLGWVAVLVAPKFFESMGKPVIALVVAGGLLYTAGAVVLLRKWPDPSPRVFGYHEVWHLMVVAASLCHYSAIMLLVLSR